MANGKLIQIFGDKEKELKDIPHKEEYLVLRGRLSEYELDKIKSAIDQQFEENVDKDGHKISVSGWMPGKDWANTPYQPIFDKACGQDYTRSGLFFGQIAMEVLLDRCKNQGENWCCMKDCEKSDGSKIKSKVYWQKF